MLKEYSDYYSRATKILQRIQNALLGIEFEERDQAVEIFAAQALSMSKDHSRSISLLLDADLFTESFAVCRFLFELVFDIVWIDSTKDRQKKLERVYALEADPYFRMAKEVELFEADVKRSTPLTSEEMFRRFNQVLERAKQRSPYLTVTTAQGKIEFRQAPPLTKRMGPDFRLQYYHIYRFTCLFTHPTPMLKHLHLQKLGRNETIYEVIEEPLKQVLAYGLLFVEIISKSTINYLAPYAANKSGILKTCCNELVQLTEKADKGYFGTAEHNKPSQRGAGK